MQEKVKDRVQKTIEQEVAKAVGRKPEQRVAPKGWRDVIGGKQTSADNKGLDVTLLFTQREGGRQFVKARELEGASLPGTSQSTGTPQGRQGGPGHERAKAGTPPVGTVRGHALSFASASAPFRKASLVKASARPTTAQWSDSDGDSLPDDFENNLADAFTPVYHVSAYEPASFATFGNSQAAPEQLLGPNPFSYFRVQPLGFGYNNWGQLVSVIRIDYLTLWDRDAGIVTGGPCFGIGESGNHDIDNERSAALVAAPVGDYNFNLDPWAYAAYSYYTAAHEQTFLDKSRYHNFGWNPVPAGWHLNLGLALSKHATYTFNPDFLPLIPDWLIYSIISSIDYWCYDWTFQDGFDWQDLACLAAMFVAYDSLYGCAVERFIEQGGWFAWPRVNVGEPGSPMNGAYFIQDDSHGLYSKLANAVW
jgi:hypothetical protein